MEGMFIFFMVVIGIFNIVFPRASWELSHGWKFKNAEPSEEALAWNRISGVIMIVIAVFMLFD